MTKNKFKDILGCRDSDVQAHYDTFVETMDYYNINTPIRIAHFLAQVGHESCGLLYTEEIADGSAYEGRPALGNVKPGDGRKYKGRGFIQITGRNNYKDYSVHAFGDNTLLDSPQVLADRAYPYCVDSAGWFWAVRKLNLLADKNDFFKITRTINGGINGLEDRKRRYNKAMRILLADLDFRV